MVLRKVVFFALLATALVIGFRPAGLAVIGAPAHPAPGAPPPTPGDPAHGLGLTVPAVSGPLYLAVTEGDSQAIAEGDSLALTEGDPQSNSRGAAEWATQTGWGAAPLSAARRASLRQASPIGQPDQQAEYARRTGPTQEGPALSKVEGPAAIPLRPQARNAALLLTAVMITVIMAVAQSSRRAEEAAEAAVVQAQVRKAQLRIRFRLQPKKAAEGLNSPQVRWGYLPLVAGDQVADWERVRLVPT